MASFEAPPPMRTRTGTPTGRISSTLLAPPDPDPDRLLRPRQPQLHLGRACGDLQVPELQVLEVGDDVRHPHVAPNGPGNPPREGDLTTRRTEARAVLDGHGPSLDPDVGHLPLEPGSIEVLHGTVHPDGEVGGPPGEDQAPRFHRSKGSGQLFCGSGSRHLVLISFQATAGRAPAGSRTSLRRPPPPSHPSTSGTGGVWPAPRGTTGPDGRGRLGVAPVGARRESELPRPLGPQVPVEEGGDATAGVPRRWLVVPCGPGERPHHHEDERRAVTGALVVVEERVPSLRVLLDVVVHPERLQDPVELLGGPPIGPVPAAVAADDGTGPRQDPLGIGVPRDPHPVVHARGRETVARASTSANPPPMQKPMTPILPVQPSWAASQDRTASTPSNALPLRARRSRPMERRQVILPPQKNRSGAAARYPSPASQSAWLRRSWLMPRASWITMTPGHGPSPNGLTTYAGITP